MKKLGKEKVITITNLDGVERSRLENNLTVYERKGKEVVHYIKGYRAITRDENGQAYLTVNVKTIKPSYEVVNGIPPLALLIKNRKQ